MSLICWNCSGLGNPQTVQELEDIIWVQDYATVFLAETWLDEARLKGLCNTLKLKNIFGVSRITRGGGLALFWREDFNLQVINSAPNFIDTIINFGKEDAWRFIGFYGMPETAKRCESWDLLRQLGSQSSLPWLCAGDFNEITRTEEKLSSWLRPNSQMQGFRDAIDEVGFKDLGYVGDRFTWAKNYPDGSVVWERLDRALGTGEWTSLFLDFQVVHLGCGMSDHKPIQIFPLGVTPRQNRPWRFEQAWLSEDGCHETIKAAWGAELRSPTMSLVGKKRKQCQRELRWWSSQHFNNITRTLKEKKHLLRCAEEAAQKGGPLDRVLAIKNDISVLLAQEEKLWQQRSHAYWMSSGDKNTSFIHSKASQCNRRNKIEGLRDSHGNICVDNEGILALLVSYYQQLFTTSNPSGIEAILEVIPHIVTEKMNAVLTSEFTMADVDHALKQMAPFKAPSPDDMPPIFY